jgi:hypothetical protein
MLHLALVNNNRLNKTRFCRVNLYIARIHAGTLLFLIRKGPFNLVEYSWMLFMMRLAAENMEDARDAVVHEDAEHG